MFNRLQQPILIVGITGGSGSGKTTLSRQIQSLVGPENCATISQDSYYLDQSRIFDRDGGVVNFDHPKSLEFSLLATHLRMIKQGSTVNVPTYDFKTHSRTSVVNEFAPKALVLIDGILILSQPEIVKALDFSIFVDTPELVRFERRLFRDVRERGRTPEGVREQFYSQVKPMHDIFVEPSRAVADKVISGQTPFDATIQDLFGSYCKNTLSVSNV